MAGSVNKAILIGHLGADPEIRAAANGNKIASFTLATSERWRDKQTGERRERTEWHRIVIFNKNLVEIAQNYLKKGAHVCVEGQIVTRKWADKSGITRYTTEIVLQQFAGSLTMLGGNNTAAPPPASDPADYGLRDQQPPATNSADPGTPTDAPMTDEFGDRIPY